MKYQNYTLSKIVGIYLITKYIHENMNSNKSRLSSQLYTNIDSRKTSYGLLINLYINVLLKKRYRSILNNCHSVVLY